MTAAVTSTRQPSSDGAVRWSALPPASSHGVTDAMRERVAGLAPEAAPVLERAAVACDLDRTLVYSAAALGLPGADHDAPPLVVAEVYQGAPLSYWTRDAQRMLAALAQRAVLVPTTTRTRAQYARIRLFDAPPRYAITTNGAHLLVDGEPCPRWAGRVAGVLTGALPLADVLAHLAQWEGEPWLRSLRSADDAFAYLVVERAALPDGWVAELDAWCGARGWVVSVQGRKVYAVPAGLTKSAAVAEVVARTGADGVLAAGDSLLDAGLLADATRAVRPAHGELHDVGWTAPHLRVTDRAGVLGGQEIVERLLADVLRADG